MPTLLPRPEGTVDDTSRISIPDPECQFVLDTDASEYAAGAVLSQIQGGEERVVAYASKTFSKPERNYCVTRKELLAIVIFLRYFRQYLYGRHVLVETDHRSRTKRTTCKMDGNHIRI